LREANAELGDGERLALDAVLPCPRTASLPRRSRRSLAVRHGVVLALDRELVEAPAQVA
jgi:hypothetical protein